MNMDQEKKGNTAVIAVIAVVVVITLGVFGWIFAKKAQAPVEQPVAVQSVPVKETQSVASSMKSADATAGWQTYVSKDFGFELKMPQTWKASDVKADLQENNLDLGMKMLTLSAKDAKGAYHDIETIVITPSQSVAKCGQTVMCNMGEKIVEKGGYVFGGVFAGLGSEPGELDFVSDAEINGVLASFK